MTRLFLQSNRFQKVLPSSFHEGEFEKIVTLQAPALYPDYKVVPFKKTVTSPTGNSKPDLVFIANDYRDWYVVEVEMAYHHYESHVEPQIRNLATANYSGPDVVAYLCRQCPALDEAKISSLIKSEPPKILLLLNEISDYNSHWERDLHNKYGVVTSVFEVYRNSPTNINSISSSYAYGIQKNYPVYSVFATTACSIHPMLTYLGIQDNSSLNLKPDDQVILELDGCVTFWKVLEGPDATLWLKMDGRADCIDSRKGYRITQLRDRSLFLEVI